MRLVNGEVGDTEDDIMHDTELYNLLCSLIYQTERECMQTESEIRAAIGNKINGDFVGREREILESVLLIMVQSAMAGYRRAAAEEEFAKLDFADDKGGKRKSED
jgi:hypothetical protein